MKNWSDKPEYIQIVACQGGSLGFAIWDFPHSHTFYPTHLNQFDDAVKEAFENGYRPVCSFENRLIMRNTSL